MPPTGYLDVAGIEACISDVASSYPSLCQVINLPEASREGRPLRALRLRAGTGDRNGVLLVGGTHARELINPDLLVRFALQLSSAYTHHTGLTYGGKVWTATDVRLVLDATDIFVVPQLNPDGRAFVFAPGGDQWWRKNRSVNAGTSCRGTDLNRNYDFLWPWNIGQTSGDPCSDVYAGSAAFSEPETRNVRWLLNTYRQIVGFVDVHSYSELLLYPWGDDDNQTGTATENFRNSAWDGLRGVLGSGYGEYITTTDQNHFRDVGARVRAAIAAVRGRTYALEEASDLYPTSGVSADYAYARFFGARRTKVWGWVFETNTPASGSSYGFQPPYSDAVVVMDEVSSGLIQLLLSTICVVREVGVSVLGEFSIDRLLIFRDQFMRRSARGRAWIAELELHSEEILRLVKDDERLMKAAGRALKSGVALLAAREGPDALVLDEKAAQPMGELLELLNERGSPRLQTSVRRLQTDLGKTIGKSPLGALGRLRQEEEVIGGQEKGEDEVDHPQDRPAGEATRR
jgi:murein tripeptide amidase MpaA